MGEREENISSEEISGSASEDNLGIAKVEIGEVTVVEYRKNQIVRLAECAIGGGLVVVAIKYRKQLPTWLSVAMGITGAGMCIYNGHTLYKNWQQDGKLIREAIKTKKIEEKKIRDARKNQIIMPVSRAEKIVEKVKSEIEKKQSNPIAEKSPEKKEIVVEKVKIKEPVVQSAIVEEKKSEGEIISAIVSPEIKSPVVEATIVENKK